MREIYSSPDKKNKTQSVKCFQSGRRYQQLKERKTSIGNEELSENVRTCKDKKRKEKKN